MNIKGIASRRARMADRQYEAKKSKEEKRQDKIFWRNTGVRVKLGFQMFITVMLLLGSGFIIYKFPELVLDTENIINIIGYFGCTIVCTIVTIVRIIRLRRGDYYVR